MDFNPKEVDTTAYFYPMVVVEFLQQICLQSKC